MRKSARLSPCGQYRYWLTRSWSEGAERELAAGFVMLNPSTADAEIDDATIQTCTRFAKHWGCSGFFVANLFTVRSPDPKVLNRMAREGVDLNGPEADNYLRMAVEQAAQANVLLVAAWGAFNPNRRFDELKRERIETFRNFTRAAGVGLWCVGRSKDGSPEHPLYHSPEKDEIRAWT